MAYPTAQPAEPSRTPVRVAEAAVPEDIDNPPPNQQSRRMPMGASGPDHWKRSWADAFYCSVRRDADPWTWPPQPRVDAGQPISASPGGGLELLDDPEGPR